MVTNKISQKRDKKLTHGSANPTLATKAYRVSILNNNAPKSVGCVTRGTRLHLLCSKYDFEPAKHWYERRVKRLMENRDTKILWDFNIGTDHVIGARCPDIVLIDKNQDTFFIDVAIPRDFHVRNKEAESID